jgi:hypothetical protein
MKNAWKRKNLSLFDFCLKTGGRKKGKKYYMWKTNDFCLKMNAYPSISVSGSSTPSQEGFKAVILFMVASKVFV